MERGGGGEGVSGQGVGVPAGMPALNGGRSRFSLWCYFLLFPICLLTYNRLVRGGNSCFFKSVPKTKTTADDLPMPLCLKPSMYFFQIRHFKNTKYVGVMAGTYLPLEQ